jgi:hypothetical protein
MQGEYEQVLGSTANIKDPFEARVLWALGRDEDALACARREEERFASVPTMRAFSSAVRAALEGRHDEGLAAVAQIEASGFADGEGLFHLAGFCVRLGQPQRAFDLLARAVHAGFLCLRGFETDVYLEPLRTMGPWQPLMAALDVKRRRVTNEFVRAGGRALLA